MRILFTTQPGSGHFHPVVPIAHACADAGHEVRFAASESFLPNIRAAGFECTAAGADWIARVTAPTGEQPDLPGSQPPEGFPRFGFWITRFAQPMIDDLLPLFEEWRPDVLVREAAEYGGCVAAEIAGIPHASIATGWYVSDYQRRLGIAALLDDVRERNGLAPDPEAEMPFRYLHFAAMPPSYPDPSHPLAPTAHLLRPIPFERSGDEQLPDHVAALPEQPTVYATLGTILNHRRDVFAAILEGLRDEPLNLIMTVGRDQDPASFGPQPDNVLVERYIPQSLLMPYCDLVLSHAGFGTIISSLVQGVPLVVMPLGADQHFHAARCEAMGVGQVIPADGVSATRLREAVREALATKSYQQRAGAIGDEIAALPPPTHAVELLIRLAAG